MLGVPTAHFGPAKSSLEASNQANSSGGKAKTVDLASKKPPVLVQRQYTAGDLISVVDGKSYQPFSADEGTSSANHGSITRSCK